MAAKIKRSNLLLMQNCGGLEPWSYGWVFTFLRPNINLQTDLCLEFQSLSDVLTRKCLPTGNNQQISLEVHMRGN